MRSFLSKYFKGDPVIWAVIVGLSLFSILAVYSSTGTLAYKSQGGNTTYFLFKHGLLLLVGIGLTFLAHQIPYRYYSRLAQLLFYLSIPLLALTLLMGTSLNEASRWLTLPGVGLTIQTSDFAKLALIMFIARLLSKNQENIRNFETGFIPLMLPVLIVCMLILPADFSSSFILFVTAIIIMFIGRVKLKYISGLIGIGAVLILIFILIAYNSPGKNRIGTWKNRIENYLSNDSEGNYQVEQSKIAIVTGGLFGKGPGHSTQRNFLPHPYSDFIYAIIIEEYGLVFGGIIVMILYLILLYRAGLIVRRISSRFGAFLAIGLTFSIVFQAMINMAVTVNLLPVTGQTLPLVSMGGSSIFSTSIAFGIILSVSRSINKPDEDEATAT